MAVTIDNTSHIFEIKGRILTLTVLRLLSVDMAAIENKLVKMNEQAPEFFKSLPLIVDVYGIQEQVYMLDFNVLCNLLRRHGFVPIGIQGIEPDNNINLADLHVLPKSLTIANNRPSPAKNNNNNNNNVVETQGETQFRNSQTRLVTRTVRSGQQIYAKGCDLVVAASVSNGAEVLADGHIHIYGALRGRALAGVSGDVSSRIFCREMHAELVAIAGQYRVNESFKDKDIKGSVQIYLQDDNLMIEPF